MKHIMNLPLSTQILEDYGGTKGIDWMCKDCRCDGLEMVWGGDEGRFPISQKQAIGWHLTYYTDWFDFWQEDTIKLNQKFGTSNIWETIYNGHTKEALLRRYEEDIERALQYDVEYMVYHVSDVSIEETYMYQWSHSDEDVIDAAAELINILFDGKNYKFKLLVENLHWPGFKFTNPELTERLLSKIHYKNKGIMLDIGHLMCTNLLIEDQKEGVSFIHKILDQHGNLCSYIEGIHLHQSISGKYVMKYTGQLPELPSNYWERFNKAYPHVLKIDTHQPWENPEIKSIIARLNPTYLVHELAAQNREEKIKKTKIQMNTLA